MFRMYVRGMYLDLTAVGFFFFNLVNITHLAKLSIDRSVELTADVDVEFFFVFFKINTSIYFEVSSASKTDGLNTYR